jgi:two-component system response regulator HydG
MVPACNHPLADWPCHLFNNMNETEKPEKPLVLIVEDEKSMGDMLATDFRLRNIDSHWCANADAASRALRQRDFDVVLTDINMPGPSGLQLCDQITRDYPDIPVIVMTAFGSLETAVSAIRAGAYDFVTKPVEMELLALTIDRAVRQRRLQNQVRRLSEQASAPKRFGDLIGESPRMLELYDQLERISDSETSILLTGESGTGKELVARTIHRKSRRHDKPFVAVNCGALPEALLESELFGHVKGAFTDARTDRKGLFQEADGGTLLLDEIGEMPMTMQVKLLRVLEEATIRPVGGDKEIRINVRLLSATNRDLATAIEEDRFREDLYYRINVIQLELPPLRSRGTDILRIGDHFAKQFAERAGKEATGVSESAAERMLNYSWPGNIRELRNVMERAVALTRHNQIVVEDLPEKIRNYQTRQFLIDGTDPAELLPMEEIERRYILHVLDSVDGNKSTAARILSLDRKTLYRKLKQYGVSDE